MRITTWGRLREVRKELEEARQKAWFARGSVWPGADLSLVNMEAAKRLQTVRELIRRVEERTYVYVLLSNQVYLHAPVNIRVSFQPAGIDSQPVYSTGRIYLHKAFTGWRDLEQRWDGGVMPLAACRGWTLLGPLVLTPELEGTPDNMTWVERMAYQFSIEDRLGFELPDSPV